MATEQSRVDRAIEAACTKLGYAGLTLDQEKAVKSFVSGRDVFLHHNIYKMGYFMCAGQSLHCVEGSICDL